MKTHIFPPKMKSRIMVGATILAFTVAASKSENAPSTRFLYAKNDEKGQICKTAEKEDSTKKEVAPATMMLERSKFDNITSGMSMVDSSKPKIKGETIHEPVLLERNNLENIKGGTTIELKVFRRIEFVVDTVRELGIKLRTVQNPKVRYENGSLTTANSKSPILETKFYSDGTVRYELILERSQNGDAVLNITDAVGHKIYSGAMKRNQKKITLKFDKMQKGEYTVQFKSMEKRPEEIQHFTKE